MDFIVYFAGEDYAQREMDIMGKWGTHDEESQTWLVSILKTDDLFELCRELGLVTFKTYLPFVNGDEPLIELIIAKEKNLC